MLRLIVWIMLLGAAAASSSSCGVYLAPSTIPGAGYGMFAGKYFREGDEVTAGDIVIPIIEIDWHTGHGSFPWVWDDYTWSASTFEGMDEETDDDDPVSGASPGIGAAINCMPSLVNIMGSSLKLDNGGLHRSKDAGVGAYTPYHDRRGMATEDIPRGQELFISYGDKYFESRTTYGLIPLSESFDVADALLRQFQTLPTKNASLQQDLWDLVIHPGGFESRALNALPRNVTQIELYSQVGTGMQFYNNSIRTTEWLEENGKCMDNIRPGRSTIPQAGRGAFATRFIPKGSVIAPAPLIHIADKSRLTMYDALPVDEHNQLARNASAPIHHQLLLNYCFGHKNSSLLLSPYGSVSNLINHSKKPNARIQWADDMRHPEWLNLTLRKLDRQKHSGLSFDFVALRDIQEGEEVLIDYGPEWEDAWNDHVKNWKSPKGSQEYMPAYELNEMEDLVIRTYYEEPYSDNLLLYVHGPYRNMAGLEEEDYERYRCRVLDRYEVNGETLYTVELFASKNQGNSTLIEYLDEVLFAVPRDALFFRDSPHSRDHRLTSSFRHEIMIPDDMFPTAWRTSITKKVKKKSSPVSPPASCGVYLAPSTIPGAGYGMFAGKSYERWDQVLDGDIVIPIIDLDWNNDNEHWNFLWEEYTWASAAFEDMEDEVDEDGGAVSGASPGIGAAVNCMDALVNVEGTATKTDNAGLHRSKDPGVGAYTPYYDRRTIAYDNILAGQELFVSYGESYFRSREETYGLIPLEEDYALADVLLGKFRDTVPEGTSLDFSHDLWHLVLNSGFESRTINALPRKLSEVDRLAETGTHMQYFNESIRTLDWLAENGKCIDNIRPGISTIPQAGRGAFATRFIPKGSLVAPAPLIHIPDKSRLLMYGDSSAPEHRQLLVNYCFGHMKSSLLLSPYGSFINFINHSSKKPNARIQWSEDMRHPEWLNFTLKKLDRQWHSGLSFDFIALRDIKEGEEVLIDYGQEWEDAWNDHVKNWKPPRGSEDYMPAYELNTDVDLVIRTMHEKPYSDNLLLYVRGIYRTMSGFQEEAYERYRCRVLDRYQVNGETMYTAELFAAKDLRGRTMVENLDEVLFAVPRDAFFFRDAPYTRDLSLTSSFRHELMIPSDMFPAHWMNL